MLKVSLFFLSILIIPVQAFAFAGGSGTCDINATYVNMNMARTKNFSPGDYLVSSNTPLYITGQPVEITLSGPEFTGILFKVVNETGDSVGTFDTGTTAIGTCNGAGAMVVVTHSSSFGNLTSYTLFWVPPVNNVGKVYVLGYVLKGARNSTLTQEFFRFVRDDNSALSLNARDVFGSSFE